MFRPALYLRTRRYTVVWRPLWQGGGYFDFVNVALLLHHVKGWLWKHATSIDTATKRENQIYRNRRQQTMVKVSPPEEILLPSWIPSSTLPPEPEPFKFGRRPPSHSPALSPANRSKACSPLRPGAARVLVPSGWLQ